MEVAQYIFRAYDIRGIVDQDLTPEVVELIGRVLGTLVIRNGQSKIIIGRDGRLSSIELSKSLIKGIVSTGCAVLNIGMLPTPLVYFANKYYDIPNAVMLTGSHNPVNYNGLKIILNNKAIYGLEIQAIYQKIVQQDFIVAQMLGNEQYLDVHLDYIQKVVENIKSICGSNLRCGGNNKIVIDAGNGVAGAIAPILYQSLGMEVIPLYCEVDGNFPNHHPDPGDPKNLQALIAAVQQENACIGFAFDGDGDRLGIVDNNGKIIWPDLALALFAQDILSKRPGASVIFDVKSSRSVAEIIKQIGGNPIMWCTGHSLIKAKIAETQAVLAAEMSGHFFFNDIWYGFDDALYAGARLLALLHNQPSQTAAQLFATVPEYVATPELIIEVTEDNKFLIIQNLIDYLKLQNYSDCEIYTIDGVRIEYADGWGLIRASNTTPKLVVRFEGIDSEALRRIQDQFTLLLQTVVPQLELPWKT